MKALSQSLPIAVEAQTGNLDQLDRDYPTEMRSLKTVRSQHGDFQMQIENIAFQRRQQYLTLRRKITMEDQRRILDYKAQGELINLYELLSRP